MDTQSGKITELRHRLPIIIIVVLVILIATVLYLVLRNSSNSSKVHTVRTTITDNADKTIQETSTTYSNGQVKVQTKKLSGVNPAPTPQPAIPKPVGASVK